MGVCLCVKERERERCVCILEYPNTENISKGNFEGIHNFHTFPKPSNGLLNLVWQCQKTVALIERVHEFCRLTERCLNGEGTFKFSIFSCVCVLTKDCARKGRGELMR